MSLSARIKWPSGNVYSGKLLYRNVSSPAFDLALLSVKVRPSGLPSTPQTAQVEEGELLHDKILKKSNFKMSILFYCFLLFLHSPLKRLSVPMLGEPVFGIGHAVFNEEFDLRPSATSGIVSKVHRMRNKVVMIQVPVVLLIIVYLL